MGTKTVQSAVDHVVATFRENNRANPILNIDIQVSWILARQFQGYGKDDPKPKQEKALPLCIIKLVALKVATKKQQAIRQLIIGTFFFACRSCEYLKVPKQDQ